MSCMLCDYAEEYHEEIDGETWLLRRCELKNCHIEDDETCEKDTSKKLFSDVLKEMDNAVNIDTVMSCGELIEDSEHLEPWSEYECDYEYHRVRIYKYKGKFYVYKEKKTIFSNYNTEYDEKVEPLAFYELK